MHPQYISQQHSGLPPGGYVQVGQPRGASRPSPSITPGSHQQAPAPQGGLPIQRMGPGAGGFPQSGGRGLSLPPPGSQNTVPNGPSVATSGSQGGLIHGMPSPVDPSIPNHLVGQMSGMNINGPSQSSQLGYTGSTVAKPGHTVKSYGDTQSAVNGVMSNELYVNGLANQTSPWLPRGPQTQSSQSSTASGDHGYSKLPEQQVKTSRQETGSPHQMTGPPQQMDGPPQQMRGSLQQMGGPPQQMGGPPQQMGGPPQQMGGPPQQMGGPPKQMGGPPQQMGGPPQQMGGPPQQMGGPPQQMGGPPQQMRGPPQQMGGPPQQMGGAPQQMGGPPQQMGGPLQQVGGPPQQQMGGPLQQMGGPPKQIGSVPQHMGGVQQQMGGPQQQMGGAPQQMGGPPQQVGGPPQHMGGPPQHMGGPMQQMGGPPQQMGGPSQQMGGPPQQMGGPPQQMGGPPHNLGGPPHNLGGPPQQMRGTFSRMEGLPNQVGALPPQLGVPPPQLSGPPSQLGGIPSQLGGPPQHMGSPSFQLSGSAGISGPLQMGASLSNQQQQVGGPHPYQSGPPVGKVYPQMQDAYNTSMGGQPPSYQPMGPGGYTAGLQQPAQQGLQSQPARRLDPDQMPSPIQVMQDDQRNRSGIFYTNQKGLVPPLVTTNFTVQDQGNASPRFIRSTMYSVPATMDMMKQTAVPFGLVISPLAEEESPPPIVNMGELGPVRCNRCKAYMCPFMQFIDGGRRFHCLFCKAATEVPAEYFQHLDHTGQRVDRYERPELLLGTYEFIATKDYCRNNTFPQPPAVVFLIDVSYNNIKSGMVQLLCSRMKEIIRLLPREAGAERSNMRVGFITYNNTVHFYNVKSVLAQPQMMVVGDLQDMFMPLLEGFLCDPYESEAVIDSLMEQIPLMFADTRETETILAPAIQAGFEALKASECSGKLLVFHSSLPIAEAPGKLKNRDDRKLLGTDKEKTVLAPQVNTYNHLGQECVGIGCSVDLFVFNNSYIDLATIGQVCRLTGGEIYKYTYFQADLDGERFIEDLSNNISRPIAFDAIMRVRTSTGVRATDFYGHFYMQNTTDMELCSIDCNKAIAIEVKHDDKLTEEDGVYVQVALLYTSCSGQRRLRIINLSLKTCVQMADLYRSCDLDTVINFFSKQAVFRLLETPPKTVKDSLVNRCAIMLACYRKNCASPSSAGQLILPECMKLLPLYINCVLKSDALSGGSDMTIDDRWFVMQAVSIMDVPSSVVYFYPRLLPLHDIDTSSDEIPAPIRCSSDKLHDEGVYLLENGIHMFIWIGLNVDVEWVQNVFGVHSAAQIDIDKTELPILDNPMSEHIRNLVQKIRDQRHRSMRLALVRQRDKLELVFKHFLMEDRGIDGSPSYVDFLCHMHKEIRSLLS